MDGWRLLARVMVWVTVCALALWALISAVVSAAGRPVEGAQVAVVTMVGVVWVSTLLSLVPVAAVWRRGVVAAVSGYFVGAAMRFAMCLVAAVLAVKVWAMPAAIVMITLAAAYLPLLFLEVAILTKQLWRLDGRGGMGALA